MSGKHLTKDEPLEYDKKYLFNFPGTGRMVGTHIQTKGNDIEFPSFDVFGKIYGVPRESVMALLESSNESK